MESKIIKSGTTIIGIKAKDAIILAADMRTTRGYEIANSEADKVFAINDYMALAWAGSVSANQMLVKHLKSELQLMELRTTRKPNISEAANLLRSWQYGLIRRPSAMQDISAFIVGGKDKNGLHLFECAPDGTLMNRDKYVADGSGSPYALGVLETHFKENMSEQEAIDLAVKVIDTAMQRDIASGNGVNVIVINDKGATKVLSKKVNTHVQ